MRILTPSPKYTPSAIPSMKNAAEMASFIVLDLRSFFPPSSPPIQTWKMWPVWLHFSCLCFYSIPPPFSAWTTRPKWSCFRAWPHLHPHPRPDTKKYGQFGCIFMFGYLSNSHPIPSMKNAAEMASFFVLGLYFPPSSKQQCGQIGCIFCVVFLFSPSRTSVLSLEYYLYT